jgi:tripartite-type tricarboxylate transporter receptor subunit TctC
MKLIFGILLWAMFLPFAWATYPQKPIELIVGNAPGGSSDVLARALAKSLEPILNQPVVVKNIAGAGGTIAIKNTIAAKPDGHTLAIGSITVLSLAPHCMDQLPYDTTKDITPVSMFGYVPNIMAVNNTFPASDYRSFIATVKNNPAKFNYAAQHCTQYWLMGETLKAKNNMDMLFVPVKAMTQARLYVMNNDVQMILESSVIIPNIKAGQMRAIAVGSNRRLADLPDVPTFAELNMPEANIVSWFGVIAPPGTDPAIVETLNAAIKKATQDPALISTLQTFAGDVSHMPPREFARHLNNEWTKYGASVNATKSKSPN